jgi:DnaJ-class molecular chaperone
MKKTFYDLLGISSMASPEEIKKAYRKLALQLHPDKNPHKDAAELFKQLTEAYKILSHAASRFSYDASLHTASTPPPTKTGGTTRTTPSAKKSTAAPSQTGRTLIYHLNISLEEAFDGAKKNISYMRTIHGKRQSSNVIVDIPPGIRDGQKLRIRGAGESLSPKQHAGDLVVHAHYAPHPYYIVDDSDLVMTVPISSLKVFLGESISVPTLHGIREVSPMSADEFGQTVIKIDGAGLRHKDGTSSYGDLYVKLHVLPPPPATEALRAELRRISNLLPKTEEESKFEEFLKKYEKERR